MTTFNDFGLDAVLTRSLEHMKYDKPTPIQEKAIPVAIQGNDVLGSAQTGTGKTAAFSIPLVQHLLTNERSTALVLTPTRELGKQVMDVMKQLLGPKSRIKTAFLIGGDPYHKQNSQLSRRPRLIVGTPGRINDHLKRGSLELDQTDFLVLDEMDRMLDMGFSVQIDEILKHMPKQRQTLMFSATMPKKITQMADKYLNKPERIAIGGDNMTAKNIKQEILRVKQEEKHDVLVEELHARDGSVIVFVKTKHGADKMAKKLKNADIAADAIHGDLKQRQRERVIKAYRAKQFRVLVATDVIARGLDVPHVEHVINFDLPRMPEDYIHRIGRTARAGASGNALCLIAPQDGRLWAAIERLMDPDAKPANDDENRGKGKKRGRNRGGFKGKDSNGGGKFNKKPRRDGDRKRDDAFGDKPSKGKSFKGKGKPFKERSDNDRPARSEERSDRAARKDRNEGGNWNKERKFNGDRPARGDRPDNRSERPARSERSEKSSFTPKKRTERSDNWKNGDQPRKVKRDGERSFAGKRDGENKGGFKGKKFSGEKKSFDKSKAPKKGGKPFNKKPRKAA